MAKDIWKPGDMLYPLPAVLVTATDGEGNDNVFTVAWTGTVSSDPAMVYISVRPSRHSYDMIKHTGQFVINLTTEELAKATDYCGVKSGRDEDKFKAMNFTKEEAKYVAAPLIKESPVNIECEVLEITHLGITTCFWQRFYAFMLMKNIWNLKESLIWQWQHRWFILHGQCYGVGKKLGSSIFSGRKTKRENKNQEAENYEQKQR